MDVLTLPKKESKVIREIQTTLNVYFPKIQFKVKTCDEENYTIINISYTDGISLGRVKNVLRHFNRPADSSINFQGIRVEINRSMSQTTKKLLLSELKSIFNLKLLPRDSEWIQSVNSTAGKYVKTIFKMRDFN